MSRITSRAENWEKVYTAWENINFAAFDYDTIKQSLINYTKLNFPESFTDFIETDELIAIIESFAYIAELLAYRIDVSAHENFLPVAQRKASILRLAKMISYSASRQVPARGLVKITSISTTEPIVDLNGTSLSNVVVRWNDSTNPIWKEQFTTVINRLLEQNVGSVSPSDRFQLQDVLFELYKLDNVPITNSVIPYNANTNGRSIPMELVSAQHDESLGIIERRPQINTDFSILYGTDGLGDGSKYTGFFFYTKQGSLRRFRTTFDGITPAQKYTIPLSEINNTDIWVNQVNPDTGEIVTDDELTSAANKSTQSKSGEWIPVDIGNSQNVIYNTNPRRNKYEIETLDFNQVRLIFGDGEFANIPGGTFDIWARTSLDEDLVIPSMGIVDVPITLTYTNEINQTFSAILTISLATTLQNASKSEDIDHIRTAAPSVYYTQDRMVSGKDYNTYPLKDPSILKLRTINRTFAGNSKYIPWYESSQTYENVKIFGNDGVVYYDDILNGQQTPAISIDILIQAYLQPILSSVGIYVRLTSEGVSPNNVRKVFRASEIESIALALQSPIDTPSIALYYKKDATDGTWVAVSIPSGATGTSNPEDDLPGWIDGPDNPYIADALILARETPINSNRYEVLRLSRTIVFNSNTTKFWNNNDGDAIINYDSIESEYDQVVVLSANSNSNRTGLLSNNWGLNVLSSILIQTGDAAGEVDINKVSVIPLDENGDGLPDNISYVDPSMAGMSNIVGPKLTRTVADVLSNPIWNLPIPVLLEDITLTNQDGISIEYILNSSTELTVDVDSIPNDTTELRLLLNEYVYFTRTDSNSNWVLINQVSPEIVELYRINSSNSNWKRLIGRTELNFMWTHTTPRYHLVDPSVTNINDAYVITKGYYNQIKLWIQGSISTQPIPPTPLELRQSYAEILTNKMISDTVVMRSGRFKLLFGDKADPTLQAKLKVIRSENSSMTDNQIKSVIVAATRNFFDVTRWEFGETFFGTELLAVLHNSLVSEISSVVIVPTNVSSQFGDLFEIKTNEDEIVMADINVEDIEIISHLNATTLRQ